MRRRRRYVTGILVLFVCCAVTVALSRRLTRPAPARVGPAQAAFERVVPVARFKQAPLEDVVRECEGLAGVPIVVDWAALQGAGVTPDTPVTLHRYGDTLAQVFDRIVTQFAESDLGVYSFEEEFDRVTLGIPDAARGRTVLRVYDVAHILRRSSWLDHPFGSSEDVPEELRDDRRDQLVYLLTETINPDGWASNGGSAGAMEARGDCLVVVQRVPNHRQLERVLADLDPDQPAHFEWPGPWEIDLEWQTVLARRAPGDVRLDGVSFEDALDHLRETFRANIETDDLFDTMTMFTTVQPITLHLVRPTLEQAALALAGQVTPFTEGAGVVAIGPNELTLTRADEAAHWREPVRYDLRPLLPAGASEEAFDAFIGQMMDDVAPDTWRDRGVRALPMYDRGAFIVQTRANHRLIRQWLDARLAEKRQRGATR